MQYIIGKSWLSEKSKLSFDTKQCSPWDWWLWDAGLHIFIFRFENRYSYIFFRNSNYWHCLKNQKVYIILFLLCRKVKIILIIPNWSLLARRLCCKLPMCWCVTLKCWPVRISDGPWIAWKDTMQSHERYFTCCYSYLIYKSAFFNILCCLNLKWLKLHLASLVSVLVSDCIGKACWCPLFW